MHVCAYPFNCIHRYTPAASGYGPYIYDTETLLGPGNNWAESEYLGDISKGFVGAWARATRGYDIVRDVWCPASASTLVGWQAAIDFRVEPGSYPDGLTAIATVVAKGQLSKYGAGTQAMASYYASFGHDNHYSGHIALESYHPDQALIIDDEFTLTAPWSILVPFWKIISSSRFP